MRGGVLNKLRNLRKSRYLGIFSHLSIQSLSTSGHRYRRINCGIAVRANRLLGKSTRRCHARGQTIEFTRFLDTDGHAAIPVRAKAHPSRRSSGDGRWFHRAVLSGQTEGARPRVSARCIAASIRPGSPGVALRTSDPMCDRGAFPVSRTWGLDAPAEITPEMGGYAFASPRLNSPPLPDRKIYQLRGSRRPQRVSRSRQSRAAVG